MSVTFPRYFSYNYRAFVKWRLSGTSCQQCLARLLRALFLHNPLFLMFALERFRLLRSPIRTGSRQETHLRSAVFAPVRFGVFRFRRRIVS
jgi:hypothetical protein